MSPSRKVLSKEDILGLFKSEFSPIHGKFTVHDLALYEARTNSASEVNSPGVYVHWRADIGAIKVGKSQTNSKARAFDHLRDNTRNESFAMQSLKDDRQARLILLNIRSTADGHWLPSVEMYMDKACEPLIPSGRYG